MRVVAILAVLLLAGGVASAQPARRKAEAAAREGQQRYQAGDYASAAERFELAYSLDPDPAYLFNLAQAYRLGNACAKAAEAYRKLLAVVASGPNVAKVQTYVEQMDACARGQATPAPSTPTPAPVPVAPVEPPRPPPPAIVHATGNPPLRYAGIAVGAVGVAAVVVGALAIGEVSDAEAAREALCAAGCVWDDVKAEAAQLDARGERYQRRAVIGLVGGGVAMGAGVVMYWLGRPREIEIGGIGVVPTKGGALAVGTLRF